MEETELKKYILQTMGENPENINFEDEEDSNLIKINRVYKNVLNSVFSKYRWSFATFKQELKDQETSDLEMFKYSYLLPVDCIHIFNVYSNEKTINFKILNKKLYVNDNKPTIEYAKDIGSENYPIYFIEYIKYKIAYELCYFLTGDNELLNMLYKQATEEYMVAVNTDSMTKKPSVINTSIFSGAKFI